MMNRNRHMNPYWYSLSRPSFLTSSPRESSYPCTHCLHVSEGSADVSASLCLQWPSDSITSPAAVKPSLWCTFKLCLGSVWAAAACAEAAHCIAADHSKAHGFQDYLAMTENILPRRLKRV